jgi:hypothetical protein
LDESEAVGVSDILSLFIILYTLYHIRLRACWSSGCEIRDLKITFLPIVIVKFNMTKSSH